MGHDIDTASPGGRIAGRAAAAAETRAATRSIERQNATHMTTNSERFGILWRYLPSIACSTLAGLLFALYYLATAAPTYTAIASLLIDPRSHEISPGESTRTQLDSDVALVESQVKIIGSQAMLRRVVETLDLTHDPEFVSTPSHGFATWLKELVGDQIPPPDPLVQALESLARRIDVTRVPNTYVVEIEATSAFPIKAARLANAISDTYLTDQKAAKSGERERASDLRDQRLKELREEVREADARLDEFKKANTTLSLEGVIDSEQKLGKLDAELAAARANRATSKSHLDQATAALGANTNPDSIPDALASEPLQRLKDQYAEFARREATLSKQLGRRHPDLVDVRSQLDEIRGQIKTELKRITAAAEIEFQVASNREREISTALERLKEEVTRTNAAQSRLREFQEHLNASRELLHQFLARGSETEAEQKVPPLEARVISPAGVPTKPARPLTWLALALGTLGGLVLGVARARIKDRADPSVRDLGGAARAAQTEPLGVILNPRETVWDWFRDWLPARIARTSTEVPFGDLIAAVADAKGERALNYRQSILRLMRQLRGSATNATVRTIMFLSPVSESGTSGTSLAVAYAAALGGERVLLVDAVSVNADLSAVFAAEIEEGQVVILDSKDHLQAIITRDVRSGLAFLPIALADLRPLKDQQRRRLVAGLRSLAADFDLIIIDAGALLEDESSASLIPAADQVVFVARAMVTSRHDLSVMSQTLQADHNRIAGIVLTMAKA